MIQAASTPSGSISGLAFRAYGLSSNVPLPSVFAGFIGLPWHERNANEVSTLAPIPVTKGAPISISFIFYWQGNAGNLTFRAGSCNRHSQHVTEHDVVEFTVAVNSSPGSPVPYIKGCIFEYNSGNDVFILPNDIKYEADGATPADKVYLNAFELVTSALTELRVTSYSRIN